MENAQEVTGKPIGLMEELARLPNGAQVAIGGGAIAILFPTLFTVGVGVAGILGLLLLVALLLACLIGALYLFCYDGANKLIRYTRTFVLWCGFLLTLVSLIGLLAGAVALVPVGYGAKTLYDRSKYDHGAAFKNSIGMEFTEVPAGSYEMGGPEETPTRRVTIARPFFIQRYELTGKEFAFGMKSDVQSQLDHPWPVVNVSRVQAEQFIANLNSLNDGYHYRLPTEAEWEYAARAGEAGNVFGVAWKNPNESSIAFEHFSPNKFGIYGMLGGVGEWCADTYAPYSPPEKSLVVDGHAPNQKAGGSFSEPMGVVRGMPSGVPNDFKLESGSGFTVVRAARREAHSPTTQSPSIGLRIVAERQFVNGVRSGVSFAK